nr:DNA-dependent RNA polymerase [Ipomoea batatas]
MLVLYTLGSVFNSVSESPAVRVSTLIEQLNNAYRTNMYRDMRCRTLCPKKEKEDSSAAGKKDTYNAVTLLFQFLLDREFICITDDLNLAPVVIKRDGMYAVKKTSYAVCNFDIDLLPVRYNLPMVCPPRDWDVSSEAKRGGVGRPQTLSDLTGGELVESGLLMPSFLSRINIPEAINLLRKTFLEDEIMVKKKYKFQDILKEFLSRVQRSRYERFILELASAYVDYEFYLPAFVDFRGRIYRAGVLHFHERDLARSLIVFSKNTYRKYDDGREYDDDQIAKLNHIIESAAGVHYQKFETYGDASQWYQEQDLSLKSNDSRSLIKFAVGASDPFQFLSKVLSLHKGDCVSPLQIPITQDASASAYQIISYLLLDHNFAVNTNLVPKAIDEDEKRKIHDIYTHILEDLKDYLKKVLPEDEYSVILKGFPRKLVKSIFMPLVYGKTAYSMTDDLMNVFGDLYQRKDCIKLAFLLESFFKVKYSNVVNLMNLVRAVGWVASAAARPVYYSTPVLTTLQDYMKSNPVNISVYDRINKKRRKVTLRVPTPERDRKKTVASIFANFIHQKDANIAFNMALWEKKCKELHDYYHSYISGVCGLCDLKDLSSIEKSGVDYQEKLDPYHGLRIATADLSGQSLMCGNCEEIVSIIMYLLIKYAYPLNADFECQSKEPRHLSEDQIASLIGGSMNSEAVVEHQEARKIDHLAFSYRGVPVTFDRGTPLHKALQLVFQWQVPVVEWLNQPLRRIHVLMNASHPLSSSLYYSKTLADSIA